MSARFSSFIGTSQLYKHRAEQGNTQKLMDAYSSKSMSLEKGNFFKMENWFSYPSMPRARTRFMGESKKWTHYVTEITCGKWSREFERRGPI